jgi:uncharacterized protein YndB with AHSA1/START domain
MNSIRTTVRIERPIAAVFAFATTPANWPRWHPASLGVAGATDHSLAVGEEVEEHYRVAGQEGRIVWTVTERRAPGRWAIEGSAFPDAVTSIAYTLTPEPDGATLFLRELTLSGTLPGGDWSVVGPVIEEESAEALRRLKAVLEAGAGTDEPGKP